MTSPTLAEPTRAAKKGQLRINPSSIKLTGRFRTVYAVAATAVMTMSDRIPTLIHVPITCAL